VNDDEYAAGYERRHAEAWGLSGGDVVLGLVRRGDNALGGARGRELQEFVGKADRGEDHAATLTEYEHGTAALDPKMSPRLRG
jgi:hypothetical protein